MQLTTCHMHLLRLHTCTMHGRYSFGWSEGKESVEAGRRDSLKASFYANPLTDTPTTDLELIRRFPTYCRPNVWPSQDLPELEPGELAPSHVLGRMIVDVGKQLLQHCDADVHSRNPHVPPGKLLRVVEQSPCHKARLLLYLPPQQPPPAAPAAQAEREGEGVGELPADSSRASRDEEAVACAGNGGDGGASASESLTAVADADVSSWCGWHLDHGSLTGRCFCSLCFFPSCAPACSHASTSLVPASFTHSLSPSLDHTLVPPSLSPSSLPACIYVRPDEGAVLEGRGGGGGQRPGPLVWPLHPNQGRADCAVTIHVDMLLPVSPCLIMFPMIPPYIPMHPNVCMHVHQARIPEGNEPLDMPPGSSLTPEELVPWQP
ncbi:unnamed protein product, partial [Closterium sp. NIES-54]